MKGELQKNMKNKKSEKKKYFVSSHSNKTNACFVENHPFLDFLICILLKLLKKKISCNIFLYNLCYFKKNIFDEIDNKIIKFFYFICLFSCRHCCRIFAAVSSHILFLETVVCFMSSTFLLLTKFTW